MVWQAEEPMERMSLVICKIITCLVLFVKVGEANSSLTLTSSLDKRSSACTGELVVLTCSVVEAGYLKWYSSKFSLERIVSLGNQPPLTHDGINITSRSENGSAAQFGNLTSTLQFNATAKFNYSTFECSTSRLNNRHDDESVQVVIKDLPPQWFQPEQEHLDEGHGNTDVAVRWSDQERPWRYCDPPSFNVTVTGDEHSSTHTVLGGLLILTLEENEMYTIEVAQEDWNITLSQPKSVLIHTENSLMSPDEPPAIETWLLAVIAIVAAIPLLVIAAVVIATIAKAYKKIRATNQYEDTEATAAYLSSVERENPEPPADENHVPNYFVVKTTLAERPRLQVTPQQTKPGQRKLKYIEVYLPSVPEDSEHIHGKSKNNVKYSEVTLNPSHGGIIDYVQPLYTTHPADKALNLDLLLIQLREVEGAWHMLGVALGVTEDTIDDISNQCHSTQECMVEVLDAWLRNHAEQPTWREVAEALRNIGFNQLAEGIEEVYVTGKLPVTQQPSGALMSTTDH